MLLLLISSALNFMWLSSVQAILLGILWVLVGAIFLGIAVIGYFFGVFALARSRDAYGHGRYAILAFIPLANLVLLLKRSKNVFSINRIPTIPLLSGGVGVTVGIMMGAASMVLSSSFQMQADGMVENADAEVNIPFLIQSQGLEETLKIIAAAAEIQLPIVIDEVTTLTSTVADGNRLLHTFVVAIDDVTLNDQHRSTIEQYVCADEMMISLLRNGATIEEVFIKADGSAIGSIVVTQDECGP